ncbi:hypothetical protein FOA52_013525 [Chlamydomonas sp. UWO 241]|nr:hypothetical protein FOA52_013525 [Chlamydomonas sp. UWO 241]
MIKSTIEQDLGKPWTEVFESIEPTAMASASVAQVHCAVLKGSRKEVVIKVLKPGVEDILAALVLKPGVEDILTADMSAVYLMSRFIEFIQPEIGRLSLTGIVGDMRSSMLDEVDFTKEAANLAVFSNFLDPRGPRYGATRPFVFSNFLDSRGLRNVATCPYVYSQFSGKRLLVMEKLNGVSLTDYAAIRSITAKDPEMVLVSALNTWFSSVVGCDTFHADVHAGNLLALSDGRVGFIDFGIVGSISPVTWKALEALATSLATADYETMARALATIGACDENVNYAAFSRDLESFFVELEQMNKQLVVGADASRGVTASVEVDQTQLNRLFLNLVRIGERHGVRFPREFGLFLKQVLYFDRYTRLLAPSLQVFTDDRINIRGLSREYGI